MVNIIDDEIWNSEPALRPDEEIMLKKLHDMLRTTADDLKLLSGELARLHEPGVQVKTQPAPLDDEFNEKVHIEEVVNAKFHGYKIVDKSLPFSSESRPKNLIESLANKLQKTKLVNVGTQVNPASSLKKVINKNLQMTRTKVVQIKEDKQNHSKDNILNNAKLNKDSPTVQYDEISYKYDEPKTETLPKRLLQIQKMPDVNIRSELKEQKVLQLDIMPETKSETANSSVNMNVGVIALRHDSPVVLKQPSKLSTQYPKLIHESNRPPVRKMTKMSTCESSESNNVSSDAQHRLDMQKQLKIVLKKPPKSSVRADSKNNKAQDKTKKEPQKRSHPSLDEWKKKLNTVYGQSSVSKKSLSKTKKISPIKSNLLPRTQPKQHLLNNSEYIPYTKLTLGGVRVSDIEREISDFSKKKDIPLSPILDKILSSRENSFHTDSPRKHKNSPRVLTTSDENLLQEVIDIEQTVNKTIAKTVKKTEKKIQETSDPESDNSDNGEGNSYADDFEDEKSDQPSPSENGSSKVSCVGSRKSTQENSAADSSEEDKCSDEDKSKQNTPESKLQNKTYTKVLNLSFKNSVDVFEFVHSIDTQETGTQSNSTSKISLKETQTSPRNEQCNIQPIHNDLWPSIDPKGEVENLFQLEKEFIKKLIIDEYGDILEKNITKPSTSSQKDQKDKKNNLPATQKNTQTSPAHVKSVMTSPTRTKTRTTSPFSLSLTVDRQTSPMVQVTQEEELRIEIEDDVDDLGISINLSSPRFSLRLPQNSREVLLNLDDCSQSKIDQKEVSQRSKTFRKYTVSSSSSIDADNSSELSSLGEVRMKLKRRLRKSRISSISESSSSSMLSRYSSGLVSGEILPLKSEGEVSLGQVVKRPSRRKRKDSDGEMAH